MQTTIRPTGSHESSTRIAGKGRKYFVPYFVRGEVQRSHPLRGLGGPFGGFSAFLRHHGLNPDARDKGFRVLHRRLSGYLNKLGILYEEPVYKTYLHCMKKSYRSVDYWLLDWLKTGQMPTASIQQSSWKRLQILLSEKYLPKIVPSWLVLEKKQRMDRDGPLDHSLPKPFPSGEFYAPEIVKLPEGDAIYRGIYYGGPVKAGGFLLQQRIPFEKDPTLYQRREDLDRGADALAELASMFARPSSKKMTGFGSSVSSGNENPNRIGNSIAVRDSKGIDHIYDLIDPQDPRSSLRVRGFWV